MTRARKPGQGMNWCRLSTRLAIYHRDGFRCVYCRSEEQLTLDHVLPGTRGGTNHPSNLVTCCHWCNSIRQDSEMRHWLGRLEEQGYVRATVRRRIARTTARPIDREMGRQLARAWLNQRRESTT